MSLLANEMIIDGILYNTKNETDRRFIGLYEERKLLTHFINNNIHIEHISNSHKFCQYDFLIKNDGILYIIELKSRLGNIKNHTYELLSISKIDKYKRICKKNIKCIFIFNHIDTNNNNNNDYYYYDVDFKNFMSGYLGRNRLPIEHYEPFGDLVENYFFFISTLWTHKNCVEHTNPWRHLYMTIIRDELKEMIFEGGFFSTSYNEETEKYSSFVLNDRIPISDYLKKTRMSAAVFNTPAVHMCHGWKLAEYMALGKAIISTPIINATPAELVHGVHLHIIESRDEMKEAILLINNNTEYRKKLEQGAYNYYKSYLSPEACINIIATKAEAIRNRLT
jgi:glycosyltransferase involved in cell wall biosynthesis